VQQPIVLDDEWFGFPVKKGNTKLLNEVNAALKAMKEDGTYAKLHKKWFGN
jgi:polar amino acid transport system substrate-binding protein